MNLGTHGQLDDEPGGVAQDEGGDQVPVDDVPQAADAPVRPTEGGDSPTLHHHVVVFLLLGCRVCTSRHLTTGGCLHFLPDYPTSGVCT